MRIHPDSTQLVAYADGDTSVDVNAIAAHLRVCADCNETVQTLSAVRDLVRDAATNDRGQPPREDWDSLAIAIRRRARARTAFTWTLGLAAASLVAAALWTSTRQSPLDQPRATSVLAPNIPSVAGKPDTAVALLSRAVAAGRSHLSAEELHTLDALVRPIDVAIRQTQAALNSDPKDSFLRTHLAELHRKRASALGDFVDLIRSRG